MAKNKLAGITLEIGGNTTQLSDSLKEPNKEASQLQQKLKAVDDALKFDPQNIELLQQKLRLVGSSVQATENKLKLLKQAQEQFVASGKDIDSAEYIELQRQIAFTTNKLDKLKSTQNQVDNEIKQLSSSSSVFTRIKNKVNDLDNSLDEAGDSSNAFGDALKGALIGGGIVAGAQAITGAISQMVEESQEYIKIMASLKTSSELAGYTSKETAETYKQLYAVLGDDQTTATTTANLQALGLSQQKLTELTKGAIGAWAKYGDSIPIDGLAESINETVKVGQVTGTFADVLNWAGTSEDKFNEKLEGTTSESQRANLVLQELSKQGLMDSADAWRENAGGLAEYNEAQAEWQSATANIAQAVLPIMAKIKGAVAGVLNELTSLFTGDISLDEFLKNIQSTFQNILVEINNSLPQFIQKGLDIVTSISEGFVEAFPNFITSILDFLQNIGTFLSENMPMFIEKGFEMLSNLVQGIVNAIPEMIRKLPQIIITFADIINENFPIILLKGVELLGQFVIGILSAIPDLIANLPAIIEAIWKTILAFNWLGVGKNIINFFGNGIKSMVGFVKTSSKEIFNTVTGVLKSLPSNLKTLGKNMITSFGATIKSMVGTVKSAVSTIFNAVWNGLKSLPSRVISIGKDIVRGIFSGISDMTGWIIDKIGGFADSVIDSICGFFGIASPSKVMKKLVGKNIVAGIGVGIEENEKLALNPLSNLTDKMTTGFNPSMSAEVRKVLDYNGTVTVNSPIQIDLDGKPIYQNVVTRITRTQGIRTQFKGAY